MKTKGATPGREVPPFQLDLGMQRIVETRINQGMVTSIDSADIDSGALTLAKNVNVNLDKTKRRLGSILLEPEKPNSEPVIKLAFIKQQDGSANTIRMTPTTIHTRGELSWHPISIATPLVGTVRDRFTTADILDTFIFSNNGANFIQKIDFNLGTCERLGDAPKYRYVFGFFNRAVGLARKDAAETEVGWSKDGDPTIWDPTTHPSAGSSPILESPADLSDFITGGLSFTNIAIIFREKSIWIATKQPIQQNPFYFSSAVPGIGCNCSNSIQIIDNGAVAWVDQATRQVYAYQPGQIPQPLDISINEDLFNAIGDPGLVFSGYDKLKHRYTIYIPTDTELVRGYTFDFIAKAWTLNEYVNLISANDTELASAGLTIDELVGTIDDLGDVTIDSLSGNNSIVAARSYGKTDGNITIEDESVDTDAEDIEFESEIRSKMFYLPQVDINVCKILISYKCTRASEMFLEYTKDDGSNWVTVKTIIPLVYNKVNKIQMQKVIRAERFMWRLRFSSGDVEILEYELYVTPSGDSHK